jgi:sulfotransferase
MHSKIHFISGLPRSGSTLLAAILRQNPDFYASVESPLSDIFAALLRGMSGAHEASMFISDRQRRRVLRSVMKSFYGDRRDTKVIFDNNRQWCRDLSIIGRLLPNARIVCCVRNIAWILDSIERLVQFGAIRPSRLFGHEPAGTVYSRVETLMKKGFVGASANAFRQAWFSELADRLVVVRYESLTTRPAAVIQRLYEVLGEKPFPHDFHHVEYDEPSFDSFLGVPGMHRVRPCVQYCERRTILPPDLFEVYDQHFWDSDEENLRDVVVL